MPITNAVLEIKFVEHESPFFEKGKQYVYELKTQAFEYSYEDINSTEPDIDDILDTMKINDPLNEIEDYGKNEDLDVDTDDDIEFDPNNPFGIS
jgi:hypothetical protein